MVYFPRDRQFDEDSDGDCLMRSVGDILLEEELALLLRNLTVWRAITLLDEGYFVFGTSDEIIISVPWVPRRQSRMDRYYVLDCVSSFVSCPLYRREHVLYITTVERTRRGTGRAQEEDDAMHLDL
ncbi:hypothetical protein B0H17DRAFT_1199680 [Mycena rosella]|uniref:Uncharacterized protein n=1 Tax=Mycena rosella TaxID=1033263 RepID=A0AAD7GGB1_MYCRO|nr:hypothetical protein B0H17DRAFT_1199680 [Mycena rosella]